MRTEDENQELKRISETLYKDKWVSLMVAKDQKRKIFGYTYSHETRCNGDIVAFLPYKETLLGPSILFRFEATPCWDIDRICMSSFTGGVDLGMGIEETVLKELSEESGYEIKEPDLINLGKMYGIKSSDSIYHLFTMNLTGIEPSKDLEVETELEKTSYCGWKILEPSLHSDDAIANALLFKIISKLNLFKNYR